MTATRVAGSEPLKITTPIIPLIHPLAHPVHIHAPSFRPYRRERLAKPATVMYSLAKLLWYRITYRCLTI